MTNVCNFPASETLTVEQALASAVQEGLDEVLIIGYTANGELFVRSSRMSRGDALWLVKKAEQHTLAD